MSLLILWQTFREYDRRILIAFILILVISAWYPSQVEAARSIVTRIVSNGVADETLVSIEATQPVRYQLRDLRPDWIVIDIPGAELGMPAGQLPSVRGLVKKLRVGQFTSDTVRVVVELIQPVDFHVKTQNNNYTILIRIPLDVDSHHSAFHAQVINQPTASQSNERILIPRVQEGQTSPIPRKGTASAQSRIHSVVGGQGIGPVKLGMTIKDFSAIIGPSKSTERMNDGTTVYRWFGPPENVGVGIRVTPAGTVYRIWVLNDPGYVTKEGLHVGSTEAEVRAALGGSFKLLMNSQTRIKTLVYDALGLWFGIQLDERYTFYNTVFEIGVKQPQ